MKKFSLALIIAAAGIAIAGSATYASVNRGAQAHGKFLVDYGGCQDCHTPGWAEHAGHAPKDMLLTGGGMNFQGPWGTTYPANLRMLVQKLSVQQWIRKLRTLKTRPAMPWWTFRYLSDADLSDMYAYIHSLGPAGRPAHAWVPPGKHAPRPYFQLEVPVGARSAAAHATH